MSYSNILTKEFLPECTNDVFALSHKKQGFIDGRFLGVNSNGS